MRDRKYERAPCTRRYSQSHTRPSHTAKAGMANSAGQQVLLLAPLGAPSILTNWSPAVNDNMTRVAEQLVAQFPHLPATTVIRVVTDCVEQFPDSDPMFIEQAARAHLATVPQSQ